MSLSNQLKIACLLAAVQLVGWCDPSLPAAEPPIRVADIASVLDINDLPVPKEVERNFSDHKTVFYETRKNVNSVLISLSDEFLKRGFTEEDSTRTRMATITVNHQGRPATIMLISSRDEQLTHVTMHHHQGIDMSVVPRLKAAGPVDQRVDETYYTTQIGVREGAALLRSEIDKKKLEVARTSSSNGIAKIFVKDGVRFVLHIDDSKSREFEMTNSGNSQATRVHLSARGNFESIDAPVPSDFEEVTQPYNSIFGVRRYFTDSKPIDAVKRAAKELTSWLEIGRSDSRIRFRQPKATDLERSDGSDWCERVRQWTNTR